MGTKMSRKIPSKTYTNDISLEELKEIVAEEFHFLKDSDGVWLELLDSSYDYDFCDEDDTNNEFYRGGERYYRPIGWKRYALKVNGKYEDDDWLGGLSQWPVAFHGTEDINAYPISSGGFRASKVGYYGAGVYVSPLIEFASAYARPLVSTNDLTMVIVLQVRVKPGSYKKDHIVEKVCPKNWCDPPCIKQFKFFKGSALEWIVSDPKNVRPYSICVKVLKPGELTRYSKFADDISSLHASPKLFIGKDWVIIEDP
eukprot:TCONS_00021315-protein